MPEVIRPDWPAPAGVRAFTSTRNGGVSTGAWRSLNLGDHCGDRPGHVYENRRRLRSVLPAEPRWLAQVHGDRVVRHDGAGGPPPEADAIVSTEPGRVCAVLTADCLPVLICNREGTRVAAAHGGWRGLAAGILERTVQALEEDPGRLMAWLGPGIGAQAYEVGGEVRAAFVGADRAADAAFRPRGERWLADLYRIARQRLQACGVTEIHGGGFCTYTDDDRFFSHRRDGVTGRMATVIWRDQAARGKNSGTEPFS